MKSANEKEAEIKMLCLDFEYKSINNIVIILILLTCIALNINKKFSFAHYIHS